LAEAGPPQRPVPAVGVVCLRGDQVLLIQRGTPPKQGEWSLPGGRIEWGEPAADAALRELREETGVAARLVGLIDVVDGVFRSRADDAVTRHFVLIDYLAEWLSGDPVAGDDAAQARFVPLSEIDGLGMWTKTVEIIRRGAAMRDQP
jgi:8-oxo-dGTP diphosphatase